MEQWTIPVGQRKICWWPKQNRIMNDRRKTPDRRVKPPKQGLPAYYTRHMPDRRQNPAHPGGHGSVAGGTDVASGNMMEKPVT